MIGHGFNIQSKYEWKGSKIDFFFKALHANGYIAITFSFYKRVNVFIKQFILLAKIFHEGDNHFEFPWFIILFFVDGVV